MVHAPPVCDAGRAAEYAISSRGGDESRRRVRENGNYVRRISSSRGRNSVGLRDSQSHINGGVSMSDSSMTGAFQVNLPQDLLSEAKRAPKPKDEQLRVEGWRNSWLSRVAEKLVGKD